MNFENKLYYRSKINLNENIIFKYNKNINFLRYTNKNYSIFKFKYFRLYEAINIYSSRGFCHYLGYKI